MNIVYLGNPGLWLERAKQAGFEIIALRDERAEFGNEVTLVDNLEEVWSHFDAPRFYLFDAKTGHDVDTLIDTHYVAIEPGDIVLDGSTSYWGDTLRRYRRMRHRAIFYIDLAISQSAKGEFLLASGEARARKQAFDMLEQLAKPAELQLVGEPGSAHFLVSLAESIRCAKKQIHSETLQILEAFPQIMDSGLVNSIIENSIGELKGRHHWMHDDFINLEAPAPLLTMAAMLEMTEALEECRSTRPLPKVNSFVHPEDIL